MQPVVGFVAHVEHRAVGPLLWSVIPNLSRRVRAALASSRGDVWAVSPPAAFPFGFDFHGCEMTARKERFMDEGINTYRLTWHGPVGDVEFDVDAFDEDDAKHTLAAWLNGDADLGDLIREV
jgi:hypothetical protein